MASSSTSEAGGLRFFSGDTEDGREYKRWKQWVKNKLLTLDKLPESSRGACIYTLLSGKALESVEHLDPEVYQKKGGDDALWTILDKRFPQQEQVDELGEILTEVFNLRSNEGESMKQWTARGSELFDRCQRKTGVSFPDEARGWLLLHRSGLTEEQKAVTIARARGDLKRESIAAALPSCYPDLNLVISRKRTGIALAEDPNPPGEPDDAEGLEEGFSDVEQLLDDHHFGADPAQEGDSFAEADVAEVLAATWREKRQELNRLQKTRQFQKAKDVKRSFRVEIEEMKRNSTCNRSMRPSRPLGSRMQIQRHRQGQWQESSDTAACRCLRSCDGERAGLCDLLSWTESVPIAPGLIGALTPHRIAHRRTRSSWCLHLAMGCSTQAAAEQLLEQVH